ncbi:hypothetical protein DVH24_022651 [Malus domestica]|uniref:Uncharacterized protein n=1 Tax=Malus domestica TaxID=3750 RepID=A0A498KLY8_MALDO|nr:hypothetical protein DVH24_022651 [Malus domestica]
MGRTPFEASPGTRKLNTYSTAVKDVKQICLVFYGERWLVSASNYVSRRYMSDHCNSWWTSTRAYPGAYSLSAIWTLMAGSWCSIIYWSWEMQREDVPSKFSRNTKGNEAIQINGIQSVRNSTKNEKGAKVADLPIKRSYPVHKAPALRRVWKR